MLASSRFTCLTCAAGCLFWRRLCRDDARCSTCSAGLVVALLVPGILLAFKPSISTISVQSCSYDSCILLHYSTRCSTFIFAWVAVQLFEGRSLMDVLALCLSL